MKRSYILILQAIFLLLIVACKNRNNEDTTGLYNLSIKESSIIKNKTYRIKQWPFHILILENEKCYEGEEWHEVMISFGGGIIIFGEKITIWSETYHYFESIEHKLTIIDENNNLIADSKMIGNNAIINIIQD